MAADYSIDKCPPLPEVEGVEIRHVPGFPGYIVGTDGNVWSCRQGGIREMIKPWRKLKGPPSAGRGYRMVQLGASHYRMIHRLVLQVFVGKAPPGHQSRHLDGNLSNNRLDNLCWGTAKENEADKVAHGTKLFGEQSPLAKLTAAKVLAIRKQRGKQTQAKLAEEFGVCSATIAHIMTRRNWKHLP